ncbi:MAG TPA: zinc ribbon domain-containing protein [Pyrinomonadaceae bacterium]|nr:zinc ribbon domain-containing protein [Pyrinomonadaceae bacterium]
MDEFLTDGGYAQTTEHAFKRVVAGDVESVRERLVYALERLGYRVISEQPLVAKRARGRASSCSFDVLKCVKSLTIGLKALNPTSTLVTFDYEIQNSMVTKGDWQTVEREAEAITALAAARPASGSCPSCGITYASDSRFCRNCGAPNVAGEPAEVEILRLTAGARVGHQSITGGIIAALGVLAVTLPLIFLSSKGPKGGIILLIVGEALALLWLFYGLLRLHRTLNPKQEARPLPSSHVPHALPAAQTAALPPAASVTEGTTELLTAPERERVAVPVKRHKTDTAEI